MMDRMMTILKILMLCFLFGFLFYLNTRDNTKDISVSEIAKQLKEEESIANLVEGDANSLKRYYSLNANDYDGFALWTSENPMDVDEVIVIKAKSDEQMDDLEESIEDRIETQKQNFEGYGAEQTALLEESIVVTRGNYIFFAVSDNAASWESIFLESIKR